MLHRILQRLAGRGAAVAGGQPVVLFRHLQVVLAGDHLRIADPLADDVRRERFGQFCLPGAAKVLEQLGPRLHAGPADDPFKLSAQVRVVAAVTGNDPLGSRFGLFPNRFQVRAKLGEDWHNASLFARVVLRLWAMDRDPAAGPVNVGPTQPQMLRRAAQSSEAAQCEQQPPFGVWAGVQHLLRLLTGNEKMPARVALHGHALHVGKGILADQLAALRGSKELPCNSAPALDCVVRQLLMLVQPNAPLVGIAGRDFAQGTIGSKIADQAALRVAIDRGRAPLHVGPPVDVALEKLAQHRACPFRHKPDGGQLGRHYVVQAGQPAGRFVIDGMAGQFGGND